MKTDEVPTWAKLLAGGAVLLTLFTLALTAAGGWDWTSKFLETSAPAWLQAIGGLGAVYAALFIAWRATEDKKRSETAIAHITALKMLQAVQTMRSVSPTASKVLADVRDNGDSGGKLNGVLALLQTVVYPTEEQLGRITVLSSVTAVKLADATRLMENGIYILRMLGKHANAAQKRKRAGDVFDLFKQLDVALSGASVGMNKILENARMS